MNFHGIPPLIFIGMIVFIYAVYITCNLLPQFLFMYGYDDPHVYQKDISKLVWIAVIFHLLFALLIISIWKVAAEEPGGIPTGKKKKKNKTDGGAAVTPDNETKETNSCAIPIPNPKNLWRVSTSIEKGDREAQTKTRAKMGISEKQEQMLQKLFKDVRRDGGFSNEEIEFICGLPVVERKIIGFKLRFCRHCRVWKPDRCHHCKICQRCVLRMDHHCPWVANCIGFYNYKYFLLMLFYAICCTAFVLLTMLNRFLHCFRPILDYSYFLRTDVPVFIAYSLSVFMFGCISGFLVFHLYLVSQALTTIELKEKKSHESDVIRHRFRVVHLKYNKGLYGNFCHVFGPPWAWLMPWWPVEGDGTYFNIGTNKA